MESSIIFKFDQSIILVNYICHKDFVDHKTIEDCASSYYESDAYDEDNSYEDIIEDIMSSFDGVEYKIMCPPVINME